MANYEINAHFLIIAIMKLATCINTVHLFADLNDINQYNPIWYKSND